MAGSEPSDCGAGGDVCTVCGDSEVCAGQECCIPFNYPCSPGGSPCCDGDACEMDASDTYVCNNGTPLESTACLGPPEGTSTGGTSSGSCSPESCPSGCCDGDTCEPGTDAADCGGGGTVCAACGTYEMCTSQACCVPFDYTCTPNGSPCCGGGSCGCTLDSDDEYVCDDGQPI